MKKTAHILLTLILIFCFISLAEGQKTITIDGVEVVLNGKKPTPPKGTAVRIKLEEELTIGESDNPDESFSEVSTFVVDSDGTIFVLDMKDRRVKVFNRSGKFLRVIGKEGQGPGELGIPAGIQLTRQNELMVEDSTNRRLAIFARDGTFIKNISFADKLGLVNVLLDSKGNCLAREIGISGNKMFFEIKKFDRDLKPLFVLDKMEFAVPIPGSGAKMNMMELMAIYQVNPQNHIYYGRNAEYEIKIITPEGKLIRSIRKEYDPVAITQEDIQEMLDRIPSTGGVNVKDMFEFPKHFSPFQYFTLDEEGRLYVRTWEKGKNKGEYFVDVFDPKGVYISQFVTKADLRVWQGNKAYGLEDTEEGFRVVKRYRVSWEK